MRSYNKVILMGNLARDPELKDLQGGSKVVDFVIAVNREWTGPEGQKSEEVSFIDCQCWGKRGEAIAKYFSKGSPIFVEGRIKQDTWEKDGKKKSRLRVTVENFNFIDSKKSEESIPACAGNTGDNGEMSDADFDAL